MQLREEESDATGSVVAPGLRKPQLGAYFRVLSHWSISRDHAVIVLPTGVGKTDTMIAIMVGSMCERVLIVVPSKALRDQIAEKFRTLGILREHNLIAESAMPPKVTVLRKRFKSLDEIETVCQNFNVLVATASLFTRFHGGHLENLAENCSHLFLDEAHHSQAPKTWSTIQKAFKKKPALLFTATPFRNDEKALQGEIIYNYPLSKAQAEGYFTKIEQHPVSIYNADLADEAIAAKAVELLEADLPAFPKHLIMARANNIQHAEQIFEIYKSKYEKYNPVLVHSNISNKQRKLNQELFQSGKSKIAVCVDMYGEGYDLPEIKIGAFHDMRRNITTALQLIGRYTRIRKDLGSAKFVYNSAEEGASKEMLKLLGDDADWNLLISNITEGRTQKQKDLEKFVRSFELPNKLPLQNLRPAFSIVVYAASRGHWTPSNFSSYFKPDEFVSIKDLSNKENTLVIVAAQKVPLVWMKGFEYYNIEHHLYIIHWIKNKKLLLIHSSRTKGDYFKGLAHALIGEDCRLINGEDVYRSLHQVERMKFHGLGLIEPFGTRVSYTHRNGSNVIAGLSVADLFNRNKRVLQGTGYRHGDLINFGMTSRGRVWSFKRDNIAELIRWGKEVAQNLCDESINTGNIIKHVAKTQIISERPALRPFTIEWPDILYSEAPSFFIFDIEDHYYTVYDLSIELHKPSDQGNIDFEVRTERSISIYRLNILSNDYEIRFLKGAKLFVDRSKQKSLTEWFYSHPPTIYFVDGSYLVDGNQYTSLGQSLRVFNFENIKTTDWMSQGVEITSESEGLDRQNKKSIQYHLINELQKKTYDVIYNDDDKGETADIVTLKINDSTNQVGIELYHCKLSSRSSPGCRLNDLYVVLGQAQKNTRWLDDSHLFIRRLIEREQRVNKSHPGLTRLRKGSLADLEVISRKVKNDYSTTVTIYVVQPGFSKAKFESKAEESNEIERLFAVTEDFIKATKQGDFYVLCSP